MMIAPASRAAAFATSSSFRYCSTVPETTSLGRSWPGLSGCDRLFIEGDYGPKGIGRLDPRASPLPHGPPEGRILDEGDDGALPGRVVVRQEAVDAVGDDI